MRFKAVLFDLDGTLLDTIDDIADSVNAVLHSLGFPTHDIPMYKLLVGEGVEFLAMRAPPEANRSDEWVYRCVLAIRDEYARRWADKTKPYDGMPALLDELSRRGVRMAILSNKPHDFTKMNVERFLARWSFDAVAGAKLDVARKPDPAGAIEIAREMMLEPREFLYLGDSGVDMAVAVSAGMFPVGALWGFRSAEELRGHGAQALIENPSELLNFLDGSPS